MIQIDSRETMHFEAKLARGGLPRSLWETYSAFANTDGGTIALGVKERPDKTLEIVGVEDPDRLMRDFFCCLPRSGKRRGKRRGKRYVAGCASEF